MLYRHSEVFRSLLIAADLVIVGSAWLGAYLIRFHTGLPTPLGIPESRDYVFALGVILPLWVFLFRARGLYEPRRTASLASEAARVVRATAVGVIALAAISFFWREASYSRGVVGIFSGLAVVGVVGTRAAARLVLRALRKRGWNQRFAVVVGGGELAAALLDRLHAHRESGIQIVGVLSSQTAPERLRGTPIVGAYSDLKQLLSKQRIDQVYFALPRHESDQLEKLLGELDDEFVSVRVVPDLLHVATLHSDVESLDGLPLVTLRESPLVGWAAVKKRSFDIAVSASLLALGSPFLLGIAAAVWLGSGRPIFYRQQRMGLDGRLFSILKFRTMGIDAERETGPVWTQPGDARVTRVGRVLRRFSLDELPQLWNVLRGDMSLVGPRPERLHFIERFRREVPGYMLRHKVRAGVTGWAQINDLRGDTSLDARIEHDLFYIQNWSLDLDLRILAQTVMRVLRSRNAY